MMPEPEIWREIAVYFLATLLAYALGIGMHVALTHDSGAPNQRHNAARAIWGSTREAGALSMYPEG